MMRKRLIFILAGVMAAGFMGTALAQDTVELITPTSGVSRVYWGPVFGNATGGASAFVSSSTILGDSPVSGTTLYAISDTLASADGTQMLTQALQFDAGATVIGGPQLVSGTSDTVILYVLADVTDANVNHEGLVTGNTLYAINGGAGTAYWELNLPVTGYEPANAGAGDPSGVFDSTNTGLTPYCTAPVTIDDESISESGGTIFGVTGSGTTTAGGSGVSVWAVSAQTGTYALTPDGLSSTTIFSFAGASGVTAVHAAPLISGDSLFVIGFGGGTAAGGGNTIYQFVKNNLLAGVSGQALVNINADLSDQWIPTPAISGGSIFVADNNGGVTSYRADNLAQNYNVDYAGLSVDGGVTASPVTDGTYIVLCGTSSVTGYNLETLSGNSKEWTFDFGANKSIWATPVISNGYVWVNVQDTILNTTTTYRFTLSDDYDGDPLIVRVDGKLMYSSPAIVDTDLWTVTYNPVVEKATAVGASAANNFPQFKFDKAKAGANTLVTEAVAVPGSSGGCFISTIK
jgi:hypothetical protein